MNFWRLSLSDLYNMLPSQIVMYTIQYCSDCRRAKAFFETHKISYLNVNLEGNEEAIEFIKTVNKGYRSVPTIIFPDGSILVEPSWDQLEAKQKTRGFAHLNKKGKMDIK